jgi:hypothetical protein
MLLADVYSMFYLPFKGRRIGGGCNFPIALTLLCVVDGLSKFVYPTEKTQPDQEKRFRTLIKDQLHWGPADKGWTNKAEAAGLLYLEFRNPLVHELAQDKVSRTRRAGFGEPVVGKFGAVPSTFHSIDKIDRLRAWPEDWPTMTERKEGGNRAMKLSAAGLYWSVKKRLRRSSCLQISNARLSFSRL